MLVGLICCSVIVMTPMYFLELKARVAKYEDASQLAKYKDELDRRGVENVLMWLVCPHIPPSVRDFLDRIGIQYSEIHEAQFRQVAIRHGFDKKYPSELEETAVTESGKRPMESSAPRPKEAIMYELNPNFNKQRLEELIRAFENAGKRTIDASLATKLRNELLNSNPPHISSATTKQLAKWCDTKGQLYFDGMEGCTQDQRTPIRPSSGSDKTRRLNLRLISHPSKR